MSTLRTSLIRLANANVALRPHLLPVLRQAKEWPSQEALDQHLKDHPGAVAKDHWVKGEGDEGEAKDEDKDDEKGESKDKDEKPEGKKPKVDVKIDEKMLEKRKPKIESEDLEGYPPDADAEDLSPEHQEEIKEYKLNIVGTDARQAVEIARKIKEGIKKGSDICKMSPAVCEGNMGLTRDKMPQIEGGTPVKTMIMSDEERIAHKGKFKDPDGKKVDFDELPEKEQKKLKSEWDLDRKKGKAMVEAGADPNDDRTVLQQMIDHLADNGIQTSDEEVPVGMLKATQSEIKAEKAFGMADAHLKGKYPGIGDSVVVSKDGHILDGHHRWAALLTIDPGRKMNVKVINMNMKDLLAESQSVPGVYKADFEGTPLGEEDQKKYKAESKSQFKAKGKGKEAALRAGLIRLAHAEPRHRAAILAVLA